LKKETRSQSSTRWDRYINFKYSQVEPLVLFDRQKNFKCFQKELDKGRVEGNYFKLPVMDYVEGDSTAAILIQSMPREFEYVFIPRI